MAKKKKAPLALLTQAEVRELADRVEDALEQNLRGRDDPDELFHEGRQSLFAAWAASAALTGDISQLPVLVHWLRSIDWEREAGALITRSAIRLAGDDPALRAQLYELVECWNGGITHTVIGWLDPAIAAENNVLTELSRSTIKPFADGARKRLATLTPPAWWVAHFEEDPVAGLTEEEVAELGPLLRRIVELDGGGDEEGKKELLSIVARLPGRAALAAGLRLLRTGVYSLGRELIPDLFITLLRHDDGPRRICDFLVDLGWREASSLQYELKRDGRAYPPEYGSLAREALSRLSGVSFADLHVGPDHPLSPMENIATDLWPPELDPTPVVEALRAMADPAATKPGSSIGRYWTMFHRLGPPHAPVLEAPFRAALACDFTGEYSLIGPSLTQATEDWPSALRHELAVGVLARPDARHTVDWAVTTLGDVAPEELIARLGDEAMRKHAFTLRGLRSPGLFAHAREELRTDRLDVSEAASVMQAICRAWGGAASTNTGWRLSGKEEDLDALPGNADAVAFRAAVEALAPAQAGRASDEEWNILRRQRRQASPMKGRDLLFQLLVPTGPWHPDDLEWMRHCVRATLDDAPSLGVFVANVLAHHPDPDALALLEQLREVDDEDSPRDIESTIDEMRQKLGLAVEGDDGDEEEATGSDDW